MINRTRRATNQLMSPAECDRLIERVEREDPNGNTAGRYAYLVRLEGLTWPSVAWNWYGEHGRKRDGETDSQRYNRLGQTAYANAAHYAASRGLPWPV